MATGVAKLFDFTEANYLLFAPSILAKRVQRSEHSTTEKHNALLFFEFEIVGSMKKRHSLLVPMPLPVSNT